MKQLDKRCIRRTAILPRVLDDGNIIICQYYWVRQYFGCTKRGIRPSEDNMMAKENLSDNRWVSYYTELHKPELNESGKYFNKTKHNASVQSETQESDGGYQRDTQRA